MIDRVSFHTIPGELNNIKTYISVRNGNRKQVGTIVWDKKRQSDDKYTHYVWFNPVEKYLFTTHALQKIHELMASIETGFVELIEMIIIDSKKIEQASPDECEHIN